MQNTIAHDSSAGSAAATNSAPFDQCSPISQPATSGPAIEPARPMPRLQPMPVARTVVG